MIMIGYEIYKKEHCIIKWVRNGKYKNLKNEGMYAIIF
jgi:hypothetical protein